MTPAIRAATVDDVNELARLRFQLYTEYTPSIAETFEAYHARFAPFAREALADPERWRAWTAEENGRLVGAMWLQTVPRVPAPGRDDLRPIGYLTNAYVEPSLRSQGIGSALLAEVVAHCEANAFELIVAWPADDAYPFYERAGFTRPPDPLVRLLSR
jgi:GNAT superfamily N-acetyltransferase